ncbi:MAG: glycosyltransferase [Alphaproteobacteria bacterium]|nr:glycosyltransferase [Alphaproteobacteria bacterium]
MNAHFGLGAETAALVSNRPVRIVHAHPAFDCGGKEARTTRLMNGFGPAAEHVILSARPTRTAARIWIDPQVRHSFPADAPPIGGLPTPARLYRLARYLRRFDLVLTYNRGSANVLLAKLAFGGPPIVHHEDGFNADEAGGLKPWRNLHRRIALRAADRLVVPSHGLARIAESRWGQPASRISRIANGVAMVPGDCGGPDPISGLQRRPGEILIGTVAGLRAVKNQRRLIRAFASLGTRNARLVIVGEGPEEAGLRAEAEACGVADRVIFGGFLPRADRILSHFDIFALSSDSEQFPIVVVEAMAAGLPIVATDVGDIAAMVSRENRGGIVDRCDEAGFGHALARLVDEEALRTRLGRSNACKARSDYQDGPMIAAYAELYGSVLADAGAWRPYAGRAAAAISSIEAGAIPRFAK